MTKEVCKVLLPLFVAFAKGEKVEYCDHKGIWMQADSIGFGTMGYHRYRINGEVFCSNDELSEKIIQSII